MSLKVWLPLTKDLRQQGLSNVTVTNGGATFESAGKLGGCYNLTGGPITISNLPNPQAISIAFWFKRTANTGTRQFMFTAWNGVTCELTTDGKPTFAVYRSSYPTITGDAITTSTGWVHYCGTFSQIEGMKLYINGSLVASNSNTTAIAWNTTTGQIGKYSSYASMSAQMNDFRIYDHCLSENEIKRLAQGLIVHYPLNRQSLGQENLLLNTGIPATWSKALNDSNYAVNDCFKTQSPVPSLFSVDELITISFDWSTTATGGNFHVECGAVTPWVWGTVISSKGTRSSASNYIDITSSNKSGHVEITFKITSSQTGAANTLQWFRIRQDGTDTANKTFTISKAKLERGSVATPWSPNSSDELATTLGLNNGVEYDISGFGNNGTRVGSFTWSSDTPKYEVSTEFNSSHPDYIQVPNSSYALQGAEAMTVSVWAYKDDWTSYAERIYSSTEGGGYNIEYNSTNMQWPVNVYTNADKTSYAYANSDLNLYLAVAKSSLSSGWHMFTWVYNTAGTYLYIDGILKNSKAATSYGLHFNTTAPLIIGGEATGTGATTPYFTGKQSDFRIYATAFSANDVKSLYQNCATIAADGTIYGQIRN